MLPPGTASQPPTPASFAHSPALIFLPPLGGREGGQCPQCARKVRFAYPSFAPTASPTSFAHSPAVTFLPPFGCTRETRRTPPLRRTSK